MAQIDFINASVWIKNHKGIKQFHLLLDPSENKDLT